MNVEKGLNIETWNSKNYIDILTISNYLYLLEIDYMKTYWGGFTSIICYDLNWLNNRFNLQKSDWLYTAFVLNDRSEKFPTHAIFMVCCKQNILLQKLEKLHNMKAFQ